MALTELETKRIEKAVSAFVENKRPPAMMRDQVDLGYRISGQSVEIFEIRPLWENPAQKIESPVAKATWVKSTRKWRIYWQRADQKWHRYDPDPEVDTLEEFFSIVEKDNYACFFG